MRIVPLWQRASSLSTSIVLFLLLLLHTSVVTALATSATFSKTYHHKASALSRQQQLQQQQRNSCSIGSPHHQSLSRYHNQQNRNSNNMPLALILPRGGALETAAAESSFPFLSSLAAGSWKATPQALFDSTLLFLALLTATAKVLQRVNTSQQQTAENKQANNNKPQSIVSLQSRFLPVFWLLRCSDWLQGPYFYEGSFCLLLLLVACFVLICFVLFCLKSQTKT